jgi:S-adenosylmethionine:tRNA-ribosyltransferase-isomerase (queuine synthetase)
MSAITSLKSISLQTYYKTAYSSTTVQVVLPTAAIALRANLLESGFAQGAEL